MSDYDAVAALGRLDVSNSASRIVNQTGQQIIHSGQSIHLYTHLRRVIRDCG
jgi:hypothetical protein